MTVTKSTGVIAGVTTVVAARTEIPGAKERLGLHGTLLSAGKLYISRRSLQCPVSGG